MKNRFIFYLLITILFFLLFAVIFEITILNVHADDFNYREFAINRITKTNHNWCDAKGIEKATKQQIKDRYDSLVYWLKELNYLYYDVSYEVILVDALEIMLHETRAVNYKSLDNGNSFGIWSMQWKTVKWIADRNNWNFNRKELHNNTHKQTKYAVWFIYWLYNYMDNKGDNLSSEKIRLAVISGYNLPAVDPNKERTRTYFKKVHSRIIEQKKLIKEELNGK